MKTFHNLFGDDRERTKSVKQNVISKCICKKKKISEIVRLASVLEYRHSSWNFITVSKNAFVASLSRKKMKLIQVPW